MDYQGPCRAVVVADYSDIGWCIELSCVFDDTLKKDDALTAYAIRVAQAIVDPLDGAVKVTWGKWRARLELNLNKKVGKGNLLTLAHAICKHPSWIGLTLPDVLRHSRSWWPR